MNIDKSPNLNHLWARLMVEELIRHGVDYFCLSSGSRSSPLTVSVGLNSRAKNFIHFDERGSAFHALGYTSATLKPAAIISTSGTAVANFLPAVIEASKKKLPLIVLTADRPPELRKTGADQTIDQVGIFGNYVRWQVDLPCPDGAIKPEFVLTTIDQAVYQAQRSPRGPVHINCMYREPLAPTESKEDYSGYLNGIGGWLKKKSVYTVYHNFSKVTSEDEKQEISSVINGIKQGVIAVGKLHSDAERRIVLKLAQKLNWPIFPDIASGLRLGATDKNIIPYYDQLLLSEVFIRQFGVDGVLHLGGRMSSKRFYQFIENKSPEHYVMVLNHPLRHDPLHNVSVRVESTISQFCEELLPLIDPPAPDQRVSRLQGLTKIIQETIDKNVSNHSTITEPAVARIVSQLVPKDHGLFLASSMPVRDMDMYGHHGANAIPIGANRGASGIDGTIATTAGFAQGLNKSVTLLLGDLALLHDLNSLSMLSQLSKPVVVVVINNDGGGIFSFLPIAEYDQVFEKYFGTPHGYNFESAAKMFKLNYYFVKSNEALTRDYKRAINAARSTIIEVKTERAKNLTVHKMLDEKIRAAIDQQLAKN